MNELRMAFEATFRDLARHGLVQGDDEVLELAWYRFLSDMREGFPSAFKAAPQLNRSTL